LLAAIGRRFLEPLILLAAGVPATTGDATSASIIAAIIVVSVALDAVQEGRAEGRRYAQAIGGIEGGCQTRWPVPQLLTFDVVPGDVFRVRAGDVVPADAIVLEVSSFTANEAALTGEPYPMEKLPGPSGSDSPAEATNALFRGSIAQTGEATALAVATGRKTIFGAVASVLAEDAAPSSFQRDLRAFGFVVARAAGLPSVALLTINLLFGRPLPPIMMHGSERRLSGMKNAVVSPARRDTETDGQLLCRTSDRACAARLFIVDIGIHEGVHACNLYIVRMGRPRDRRLAARSSRAAWRDRSLQRASARDRGRSCSRSARRGSRRGPECVA
jgi:hypothetical protein